MNILGSEVFAMVQVLLPYNDAIFQEDDSPHTHTQKCSVSVWGAWRCTSASSVASTVAQLKYCRTSVGSYREQSEKQISSIITQATSKSCTDYSEFTRVYSKKDTSCVRGKWWPNSILIKKYVSCGSLSLLCLCKLDWSDIYCLTQLCGGQIYILFITWITTTCFGTFHWPSSGW
jgi:hypothetical protein